MRTVIDVLKRDHARAKKLLAQLNDTRDRDIRRDLLEQIETELVTHTAVEEEIVYPAIRRAARSNSQKELVAESYEEHRTIDQLVLPDLKATPTDSVEFGGRARVLMELIEHHVEEEEDELLPLAEKLLSDERLVEMGEEVLARKQQLLRERRAA